MDISMRLKEEKIETELNVHAAAVVDLVNDC